jgi:predicted deacylase
MLSTLVAATVGHSVQHRPIEVVHIAGSGPRVLVVGAIHGDEPAGIAVVRALERTHPRAELWLVPVLNPDGLAAGTRGNAHGVDLNRNFPSLWQHFGRPAPPTTRGRDPSPSRSLAPRAPSSCGSIRR